VQRATDARGDVRGPEHEGRLRRRLDDAPRFLEDDARRRRERRPADVRAPRDAEVHGVSSCKCLPHRRCPGVVALEEGERRTALLEDAAQSIEDVEPRLGADEEDPGYLSENLVRVARGLQMRTHDVQRGASAWSPVGRWRSRR